ncbi:elongator complex protein 2 [Leptidea sinapis]|uniref:elongator complex protein 2 n=1 Tax=Leptidea sinapis TaxID=189913 RepID=UPI0021262163|nr:elongator complex protein 2 [Leptidea sinapis]
MKTSVRQVYTSVACNRTPEILDWNKEGFMCFGASNSVVIYDTNVKGKDPLIVLCQHQSRVNNVKWLRKPDGSSTELVSASADKTAVVWSLKDGAWRATSNLLGHQDSVTTVYGIYTGDDELTVFTGSIDSTVKVWTRCNDTMLLKQTISLNSGLCLTIHAQILPAVKKPLLFLALDDNKIHVFALNSDYHRVDTLVGHEDWVRGVDSYIEDKAVLLASASQDTYIRLWRIQEYYDEPSGSGIRMEDKTFIAYGVLWSVKLDAVLAGHEGWVYGVHWDCINEIGNKQKRQQLLSSSLDKTIIIWQQENTGAWVETVRVGEVGGNGLGFYGSKFGPNAFVGHGYNGSLHMWKYDKETGKYDPSVVVGGHFGGVEAVCWEPSGQYLLSVSQDQTARVHAPWKRPDGSTEWHEVARPQVHGYDLTAAAAVSPDMYVSAADEKLLRVFRATNNFVDNLHRITGVTLVEREGDTGPEGASVPSLGLSNKAVFTGDDLTQRDDDNDGYFVPVQLHGPPTEETLMQNTLWPEVQKLYGHGYEVFCVDVSPDGSLLASACRATTPEHAAVLLWEVTNWQQIQKLVHHSLTVTQLAFSPNSRFLLSVSRDRKWSLFIRKSNTENRFELAAYTDKTNGIHARIIWCCAWISDSKKFLTGSRDGKVCVWSQTPIMSETSLSVYVLYNKLGLDTSVTSLAATAHSNRVIIAVGLDTGLINLYHLGHEWTLLLQMDHSSAHHMTVKRLAFRPRESDDEEVLLASGGADGFVRIHRLRAA